MKSALASETDSMMNQKMPCSICRHAVKVRVLDPASKLFQCANCSHVFKNLSKSEQENYAEDYFSETHEKWFANPNRELFEFIYQKIFKLIGNSGCLRILDAGCGKGDLLKYLQSRDPELQLYGIDLIENKHPGIHFIRGDILTDLIDMKFQVVCSLAMIEHLDSPDAFIQKTCDLLESGGCAFVMTIDNGSLMYWLARFLKKFGLPQAYNRLYSDHHLQYFTKKSLRSVMEMNGLKTIFHFNHNYPFNAVDVPEAGYIMTRFYLLAVRAIFFYHEFLTVECSRQLFVEKTKPLPLTDGFHECKYLK